MPKSKKNRGLLSSPLFEMEDTRLFNELVSSSRSMSLYHDNLNALTAIKRNPSAWYPLDIKELIELAYKNPAYESVVNKSLQAEQYLALLDEVTNLKISILLQQMIMFFVEIEAQKLSSEIQLAKELEDSFRDLENLINYSTQDSALLKEKFLEQMLLQIDQISLVINKQIELYSAAIDRIDRRIDELSQRIESNNNTVELLNKNIRYLIHGALIPLRNDQAYTIEFPELSDETREKLKKGGIAIPTNITIYYNDVLDIVENKMYDNAKNGRSCVLTEEDKRDIRTELYGKGVAKDIFIHLNEEERNEFLNANTQMSVVSNHAQSQVQRVAGKVVEIRGFQERIRADNAQCESTIESLKEQRSILAEQLQVAKENKEQLDELRQLSNTDTDKFLESVADLPQMIKQEPFLGQIEIPLDILTGYGALQLGLSQHLSLDSLLENVLSTPDAEKSLHLEDNVTTSKDDLSIPTQTVQTGFNEKISRSIIYGNTSSQSKLFTPASAPKNHAYIDTSEKKTTRGEDSSPQEPEKIFHPDDNVSTSKDDLSIPTKAVQKGFDEKQSRSIIYGNTSSQSKSFTQATTSKNHANIDTAEKKPTSEEDSLPSLNSRKPR